MRLLILLFALQSCAPDFSGDKPDKLFIKRIKTSDVELDWYYHSLISNTTPYYVTLKRNDVLDTICVAHNIADVNIVDSTVMLGFYGSPSVYSKSAKVKITSLNYSIKADTSYNVSHKHLRGFFKVKERNEDH
jgi:hypothetical protein